MKQLILAVGRMRDGVESTLYHHYAQRLRWPIRVIEVEARKMASDSERQLEEEQLLRRHWPAQGRVIVLDERGQTPTSPELAKKISQWRDDGAGDLAWVIGGADGLTDSIRQQSDWVIALGRLTWPHMLVRGLIAEQIYRCQQILAGHPYHRD